MSIISIVGIGLICAVISILLKRFGAEMGMLVSLASGALIFFIILPYLSNVMLVLTSLTDNISVGSEHIAIIFRVLGVAYIAEFGAQVCKDSGEGAIASKIELGGKVIIMVISAPIIVSFLNLILGIV
ncbi:MAG: stage III sporulation protein AD [Defluviitaleaceae bacterium]|nr:stage III sporulation protein AD [Defluviitaleaceae bacterium]